MNMGSSSYHPSMELGITRAIWVWRLSSWQLSLCEREEKVWLISGEKYHHCEGVRCLVDEMLNFGGAHTFNTIYIYTPPLDNSLVRRVHPHDLKGVGSKPGVKKATILKLITAGSIINGKELGNIFDTRIYCYYWTG